MSDSLDFNNIQGDILEGLPKKKQTFLFFRIAENKAPDFCTQLLELIPFITTAQQAADDRARIAEEKRKAAESHTNPKILELSGINIAFSQSGLLALSIADKIENGDTEVFTKGMIADAANLNDRVDADGNPVQWDEQFIQDFHGVILVTASSRPELNKAIAKVNEILGTTIDIVHAVEGKVRPGDLHAHEHFGFADGISQPLVEGVPSIPLSGQEVINPGVILLGRQGDPAITTRPQWAKDGSFLAFRKLQQLVPEFDDFLEDKALPGANGKELLGARLVGRWKSGAPVDLAPTADDPVLGNDISRNNDFRYDARSQDRCPFGAHTRKTNPRADLDLFGGSEIRRILRRGIQFGPEVTAEEAAAKTSSTAPELERGLMFVSYQSSLSRGFQFIQKSWANNPNFPPGKGTGGPSQSDPPANGPRDDPAGPGIGLDPIIGVSAPGQPRFVIGANPDHALVLQSLPLVNDPTPLAFDNIWVVPKGGEYFFSPSIAALQDTFAQAL